MVKTRKKQRRVALTQNQTENEAQDHNHGEAQDMSLLNMQDQPHHESDTHSTVISPPSIHYSAVQEGHEGSVIDGNLHNHFSFFSFFKIVRASNFLISMVLIFLTYSICFNFCISSW